MMSRSPLSVLCLFFLETNHKNQGPSMTVMIWSPKTISKNREM